MKYCWFWNHKYSKSFYKNKNWFQPIVSSAQIQQKPFEMQKTLQFYPIICTKKQSFKIRFCQKYQKRRSLLPISAPKSLYISLAVTCIYSCPWFISAMSAVVKLCWQDGEHITDIYITETGTTELENLSHNIIDIFITET